MANYFDQFDPTPQAAASPTPVPNFFDQFDPKPVGTAEDVARAGASGVLHGAAQTPGGVGSLINAYGNFMEEAGAPVRKWLADQGIGTKAWKNNTQAAPPTDYAAKIGLPTADKTDRWAQDKGLVGPEYQGQTGAGQIANYVGHLAPAAIGAAGPASALLRVATTAAGSKGAQYVAQQMGASDSGQQLAAALGGISGFKGGGIARSATDLVDRPVAAASKQALALAGGLSPDPSRLGAFGGNITLGPQGAASPGAPAPINRGLVARGRVTPESFQANMRSYNDQGVTPFEFQGYGPQAGVAKTAALARMDGQTGTLARETIDPARADLQTRALTALDRMSGGKTRFQANQDLEGARQAVGAQYEPVLQQPVAPQHLADLESILQRVPDAVHEQVTQHAADLAKAEGAPSPVPVGKQLQYTKRALWDYTQGMPQQGLGPDLQRALQGVHADLATKLGQALPGYADLDQQYGDIQKAFDAVGRLDKTGVPDGQGQGGAALAGGPTMMRADEVAHQFQGLPPIAQDAYGVGAANRLGAQISGKAEGYNPGTIAGDPEAQAKLGVIFGDRAQPFIDSQRLIRKDAGEYNLVSPERGSQTAGLTGQMQSEMNDTQAALHEGPLGFVNHLFGAAVHKIARGPVESYRNAMGSQLLNRLTPDRQAQFLKQLQDIQNENQRQALAQGLIASQQQPQQQPGAQP